MGLTPEDFALEQSYPNPFNPTAAIPFSLPEETHVSLSIYDVTGRELERLIDETLGAGWHSTVWQADDLPSGTYFYQLKAGNFRQTRSMVLVK